MGFLNSIANTIGDLTYSALGGKASAKQQYENQKEYMQNAHQWEIQDLEKAKLNPLLSALGNGATGTASGGTMSGGLGITDALKNVAESGKGIYEALIGKENETKLTNAQVDNLGTESAKNIAEAEAVPQYLKNDTQRTVANSAETQSRIDLNEKEGRIKNEELAQLEMSNAILEVEKMVNTGKFGEAMAYVDKVTDQIQKLVGIGSEIAKPLVLLKGAKNLKELHSKTTEIKNNIRMRKSLRN